MSCRTETFKVSGAKSVKRRFCRTVHGPVQATKGSRAYARRYAIWGREMQTFIGLAALNDATLGRAGRRGGGAADLEREPARRRRRRPHRLVAPGPAAAAPEALGRAAAAARHGRGGVARAAPGQGAPEGDRPAAGLPRQLEQPAVGGLDPRRRPRAGDQRGRPAPRRVPAARSLRENTDRTLAGLKAIERRIGTTAQQRPLLDARLQAAQAAATGPARTVLDTIVAWDGNYDRQDAGGTVDPGVAAYEALKEAVEDTLPRGRGHAARPARRLAPVRHGRGRGGGFHAARPPGSCAAAGEAAAGAGGALRQRRPGGVARAAQALRGAGPGRRERAAAGVLRPRDVLAGGGARARRAPASSEPGAGRLAVSAEKTRGSRARCR